MNKKVNTMMIKAMVMFVMVFGVAFGFTPGLPGKHSLILNVNAQEEAQPQTQVQAMNTSGSLQLEGFSMDVTSSEDGSNTVTLLPTFSGDIGNGRYLLRVTSDDVSGTSVSPTKRFDATGSIPSSCQLNTSKLVEGQTFVVALYKEDFNQQYLIVNSFTGSLPSMEEENVEENVENNTANGNIEKEDGVPGCQHEFEYLPCKDATVDSDALLAYTCIRCGEETKYTEIPNSAYATFLVESIKAIKTAGTDADTGADAVTIRTDRWISFNYAVLTAISERPDLNVTVEFMYHGELRSFKIPAGTDVLSLADENGYAGFLFLEQEMTM